MLVGAHGANMANMLFAPDGMKVVEIVPQAGRGAGVLDSQRGTLQLIATRDTMIPSTIGG